MSRCLIESTQVAAIISIIDVDHDGIVHGKDLRAWLSLSFISAKEMINYVHVDNQEHANGIEIGFGSGAASEGNEVNHVDGDNGSDKSNKEAGEERVGLGDTTVGLDRLSSRLQQELQNQQQEMELQRLQMNLLKLEAENSQLKSELKNAKERIKGLEYHSSYLSTAAEVEIEMTTFQMHEEKVQKEQLYAENMKLAARISELQTALDETKIVLSQRDFQLQKDLTNQIQLKNKQEEMEADALARVMLELCEVADDGKDYWEQSFPFVGEGGVGGGKVRYDDRNAGLILSEAGASGSKSWAIGQVSDVIEKFKKMKSSLDMLRDKGSVHAIELQRIKEEKLALEMLLQTIREKMNVLETTMTSQIEILKDRESVIFIVQ
jgi:hypothetical protein